MRTTSVMVAALVLLAFSASGQEEGPKKEPAPAGARHKNEVSPEAKACIEAIGKAMYSPVAAGLKRLQGTMTSTEKETTEGVAVDFQVPEDLSLKELEHDLVTLRAPSATESNISGFVRGILRESLGLDPFLPELQSGEYDAEVATEGGMKVLVLKGWHEGECTSESRYALNADGLPASAVGTEGTGSDSVRIERAFEYSRAGAGFLLARSVKTFKDVPMLRPLDITNGYTEANGLWILTAMDMKVPMGGPVFTRWRSLSVNGKKVDLPPEKPVEKAAPKPGEARSGKDFRVARSAGDLKSLSPDVVAVRIRGIADGDVAELARFRNLKEIDFSGGWKAMPLGMTAAGFTRLAGLDLPLVKSINLQHSPGIDDECLRNVGRMKGLTMVTLNDSTGFSAKGLASLLKLPVLAYLDLRRCTQVDDTWGETLAACPTLTQLGVTATGMTKEGIARLRAALPDCHVDDEVDYIEAALDRALYPGWGGPPERKGR